MSKSKLQEKINAVNKSYNNGLNDDDQVAAMVRQDKITKGWSFMPTFDTYILVSDIEKIEYYVNKYGYWSQEVKRLNETLKEKGGYKYMTQLNKKFVGTNNVVG